MFYIWISIVYYLKSTKFLLLQNNQMLIGISESKLDLSILNCEIDAVGYDVIRIDRLRRRGRPEC